MSLHGRAGSRRACATPDCLRRLNCDAPRPMKASGLNDAALAAGEELSRTNEVCADGMVKSSIFKTLIFQAGRKNTSKAPRILSSWQRMSLGDKYAEPGGLVRHRSICSGVLFSFQCSMFNV